MSVLQRAFFNLSVIKAPLLAVAKAFDAYPAMRVQSEVISLVLPEQPYQGVPGGPPLILWSPTNAPDLTAFMPHVSSGDDYVPTYAYSTFKFEVLSVRSTADDCVRNCINEFVAYSQGGLLRMVRVMSDSPGWDFCQMGQPLPFEALEKYRLRLKRERLRRHDLISYLEACGAPVSSLMFWQSQSPAITFVPRPAVNLAVNTDAAQKAAQRRSLQRYAL